MQERQSQLPHSASQSASELRHRFAYNACWVCVFGAVFSALIVVPSGAWNLLLGAAGVFFVGAMGLFLLQRGLEQAAYRLLALGGWLVVVAEPAFSNGLHSVLLVALPIVLLLAAWLLGARAAVWLGVATAPVLFAYGLAQSSGLLVSHGELAAPGRALILSIIAMVAAALGYFGTRTLDEQLRALEEARRQLERNLSKLAKRDEELSLLTERVPAMIAHFDSDCFCRFCNSAYARFHGWEQQNVIGHHAREVIGEDAFSDIEPGVRQALAGEPCQQAVNRQNASGETRTLSAELVPSYDTGGEVNGWYALIRDVTETERAHRALRHIVEGTARATGADFFKALAKNLAQATGLAQAMIAELLPDRRHARVLAHWTGKDFREGEQYALNNPLGQQVLDSGEAYLADGVAEYLPQGETFGAKGIRGYYGLRLDAPDNTPLGLLVVMDHAPIRNHETIASLVSIFGARAAAEIERTRAESESRKAGERFTKVFQNSPVPITITSLAEGRFIDVNQACVETFGWPREEIIGRTAVEIGLWPGQQSRASWARHLGNSRIHEVALTLYNGKREPRSVRLSADTIELDGVPHIISFIYDETLHKQAEQEQRLALERFEAIFQHTPNVAIQGFNAEGKLMHWNRASERVYGIAAAEALGQPIQGLLHSLETTDQFAQAVTRVCAQRAPSDPVERPVSLRDGRLIWVLSTMFPMFSGDEVVEIFCMDVDVTELKHATEAARELNVQLEARVTARTVELAELNRELEAFSYSISHDLRAPLRSIQGFGSILDERIGATLDDASRDYLRRMVRAAQRLAQLIDDLLELTRINRAEVHPVEIDLSALAIEILDELRHGAPERVIEVQVQATIKARGDPQLLRLALQNLLDNAWKYSSKVSAARIEFGCRDDQGQRVFYVRDNGAGFDMAYADKLFAPFQRLHNPRDFEGTGVGLASVARVIHRHGGRVWANSEPSKGAEFCFTLAE